MAKAKAGSATSVYFYFFENYLHLHLQGQINGGGRVCLLFILSFEKQIDLATQKVCIKINKPLTSLQSSSTATTTMLSGN